MIRTRVCVFCGVEFSYEVGRGKDRVYCSDECLRARELNSRKVKLGTGYYEKCSVEGCLKDANRIKAGLCEAHYAMLRRRGCTKHKEYPLRTFNQAGYVKIKNKSHPLSDSSGTVYEHRMVFYNIHGEGPFKCHWCGKDISWYNLHIDHLNNNITDNNDSNLVASCAACNIGRGQEKSAKTMRSKGKLLTYGGETMCVSEWARRLKIRASSLQSRLNGGWTIEKALTEPRGITGPKTRIAK